MTTAEVLKREAKPSVSVNKGEKGRRSSSKDDTAAQQPRYTGGNTYPESWRGPHDQSKAWSNGC